MVQLFFSITTPPLSIPTILKGLFAYADNKKILIHSLT